MEYSDAIESLAHLSRGRQLLGRAGLATQARICIDMLGQGRSVAWVVRDRDELIASTAFIRLFSPEVSSGDSACSSSGPWISLPPFPPRASNREGWSRRLAALHALCSGTAKGIILTADNLLCRLVPLSFFNNRELRLRRGEDVSLDMILEQATLWGYERVSMVSNPGEIARRGDILDIMPPGYDKPVRLDFFGDLIEEIKLFDAVTQRSKDTLEELLVLPVSPTELDTDHGEHIRTYWKTLFQQGRLTENERFGLTRLLEQQDFRLMPGCCSEEATVLEDWLPADTLWMFPGRNDLRDILASSEQSWSTALAEQDVEGRPQPQRLAIRGAADLEHLDTRFACVHAEPLLLGTEAGKEMLDLPERAVNSFEELFSTAAEQDRPWQTLIHALKNWQNDKRQVVLAFTSEKSRSKFLNLATQDGFSPFLRYAPAQHGLFALVAPVRHGCELMWDHSLVLGEDVLQPHVEKSRRVPSGAFKGLDRYDELAPGDLLVHRDYGIARFGGLQRMETGSTANDYLLLFYSGDDRLYVPVDRLSLIQRFKGGGDTPPQLDRLGGGSWQSGKEKARKAIEKIAEDLVEMYAWRKVAKGFRYPPLGELYREFEASFGFEETPDQARAIQDVLNDMEKPEPMDRLVCGDVGFGKTEVALRAAFRAATEGRQVALLCPTTVLAEQHYQTFRSRLSGFAINVGLLSRFVSPAKQKEVLKAAASGQIDILIGTHRLLSDDVVLPNLGLLILDEEQRFGVRHKEKLKKLRKNVDALTLTATPIPRTLQLSMSGVRELSVIETAPPERKPVATALLERDKGVLQQIVERELARQGQVFWVHNRVQGLERVVEFVRELAPNARIGMAHGQMPEKKLEETMHAFWHGELDILVCTAIVESGLDFPRANTLIVDQAQLFGLGQLYQLRGRVGRSDRQAFACFVVSDINHLPEITRERLRIILDMDYLGAGFQVAMEDLRLRGAGNILGEAQSGHMGRVGLDLYLEMLEQAVNKIKNGGVSLQSETELNLGLTAHIPEDYITDGRERLRWYKRLSAAVDAQTRHELELELRDRFGALPEPLEVFIAVLSLKRFLTDAQALKADVYEDRLRILWDEKQNAIAPDKLVPFLKAQFGKAKLLPPAGLELKLDMSLPTPERLDAARLALGTLVVGKSGE